MDMVLVQRRDSVLRQEEKKKITEVMEADDPLW